MTEGYDFNFSLYDALSELSLTALRKIAKAHSIKRYTSDEKADIIEALLIKLLDVEFIKEVFYILAHEEWEFFKLAAKTPQVLSKTGSDVSMLVNTGIVYQHLSGGIKYHVVPSELRMLCDDLTLEGIPVIRDYYWSLNLYASAAVNLYGAISQDDFVTLFNSHNECQTSIDEMFPILLRYVSMDFGYCFWDEYILNNTLEEGKFKYVESLVKMASHKERYLPSRDEFLKYSNPAYYEVTSQVTAVKQYLDKSLGDKTTLTNEIVDNIHFMCNGGIKTQDIIDVLEKNNLNTTLRQTQEFVQLVMEMNNNTRMWINNGRTPYELLNTAPVSSLAGKVGRNEPCPCGSGKKYKRCCYLKSL